MSIDRIKYNLHVLQNKNAQYSDTEFNREFRLLLETSPELQYEQSKDSEDITTGHYPRRQLLINEIEFLCLALESLVKEKVLKDKKIVAIYAGAAPGQHLRILAELFPFICKFILIDPENFNFRYGKKYFDGKLEKVKELMNERLAEVLVEKYSDQKGYIRLFISDIRKDGYNEDLIKEDMNLQRNLHNILKPFKSYLKFRLPYVSSFCQNSKENYLNGDIYFLIRGRSHSSETRLLVHKDAGIKEYDYQKYENQMFYFNHKQRPQCFNCDINGIDGFDNCYDCTAELYVLKYYLNLFQQLNMLPRLPFNNAKEFANFITDSIKSNDYEIKICINIDKEYLKLFYIFTDFNFGTDCFNFLRMQKNRQNKRKNNDNFQTSSLTKDFEKLQIKGASKY